MGLAPPIDSVPHSFVSKEEAVVLQNPLDRSVPRTVKFFDPYRTLCIAKVGPSHWNYLEPLPRTTSPP
ncbi:hypothetical protein FA13DRAFT_1726775 [Coprinellus micaceus]|uniref:Uncharacterized protein n=1 Tax=Coprinellus micaceus TaxID=71717 RepID=A0A4Y7TUK7_COPMI|nr:hypothetical protein FA13DRAFT_1726775 [Coprinellus micaceus]